MLKLTIRNAEASVVPSLCNLAVKSLICQHIRLPLGIFCSGAPTEYRALNRFFARLSDALSSDIHCDKAAPSVATSIVINIYTSAAPSMRSFCSHVRVSFFFPKHKCGQAPEAKWDIRGSSVDIYLDARQDDDVPPGNLASGRVGWTFIS
jgi:hypothetical protein